jgi:hypothetical protein
MHVITCMAYATINSCLPNTPSSAVFLSAHEEYRHPVFCGTNGSIDMSAFIYGEPGQRSRYSDWLWAGRLRGQSSSPGRVKNFLHVVKIGSGAHPASYPVSTGGSFPGAKATGADQSPPTRAEVKKTWIYTSTPPYV